MKIFLTFHKFLKGLKKIDFIGLFLLRLYLFSVFWYAGTYKYATFEKFSDWIGSSLNIPYPEILTWIIISAEAGGSILLLIGLFVRWASIPLIILMANAIILVHWQNGWSQESNGIEMAVTYAAMLLILLFSGGGKYFSLDYWITRN
tara:strand:+ start:93 stop:533 length:441 start_codon:yes stop_codon:yes gene_type:complete